MTRPPDPTSERPGGPTRREVLLGTAGALAAFAPGLASAEDEPALLPRRPFGKTGAKVTVFGLGCYPLGSLEDDEEGAQVALRALRAGCNYLDTAPSYARGRSERRVGAALKAFGAAARKRTGVLVATKTHTRTRDDAWRDIQGSLERLGLERIDVLQIHAIRGADDLTKALDAKKGPLKALLEAREQKLIRWIGVTGHWDPAVMRDTFRRHDFDSILFPLNCVDPHYRTRAVKDRPAERLCFLDQTLPAAVEHGLARVAMKVFSSGRLTQHGIPAQACLRFTYALDIATCVVGCKSAAEVDLAARVARESKPLSAAERKALLASTAPHAGRGTEWYKRP